jgi:hypothetical protein
MYEKEKHLKQDNVKKNYDLKLSEFYKAVNKAIINKNVQTLYGLSKIFNRNYLNNSKN